MNTDIYWISYGESLSSKSVAFSNYKCMAVKMKTSTTSMILLKNLNSLELLLYSVDFSGETYVTKKIAINSLREGSEVFKWIVDDMAIGGTLSVQGYSGSVSSIYKIYLSAETAS